jgi:hypothetical protein
MKPGQQHVLRPEYLLHAEAWCILSASCGGYLLLFPHHWLLFMCLFLVPDPSLLMYVRGPSPVASMIYNVVLTYTLPLVLGGLALRLRNASAGEISLIWMGHIGMDRVLGFGLKQGNGLQDGIGWPQRPGER